MRTEPDLLVRIEDPGSSAVVRRSLRALLGAAATGPSGQLAQLAAAELVNNVVRHTSDGGSFAAWWVPEVLLRIEVSDADTTLPSLPAEPPARQLEGRGLHIVDTVASRWGMYRSGDGKTVWCELDWSTEPTEACRG